MRPNTYAPWLLRWLPQEHRKPLLQRLLIVWAVSLVIVWMIWFGRQGDRYPHTFDVSLVYSYAISTFIWLFTDVLRFVFKRALRTQAPHYWPPVGRATLVLLIGTPAGYVLGTLVGDAYSGRSSWDWLYLNSGRFKEMIIWNFTISAAFVAYFYQRGKAASLASEVTQARLMLLQSQLEPHMLFNTLAHLRALIGQDTERALAMLDHLNDFLRTTLEASRRPLHPLADEVSRLRDYLSLMAIRMGPRLAFSLDVPTALAQVPVPSFLLQPLVENAIRHGLEPVVAGGRVEVQARAEGGTLVLSVRDNGSGISELALADASQPLNTVAGQGGKPAASWGLSHVRQRLHTVYGDRAELQISRAPGGGTCVLLRWPLEPGQVSA